MTLVRQSKCEGSGHILAGCCPIGTELTFWEPSFGHPSFLLTGAIQDVPLFPGVGMRAFQKDFKKSMHPKD